MLKLSPRVYIFFIPIGIFLLVYPIIVKSVIYADIFVMFCLMAGLGGAWNIIGGYGGQFSIGHAGFFGIGAYTSTLLYLNYNLSPWIGMLAGGSLSAIISLLVFYPCFRLRGVFFTMASLAFAEILMILSIYWTSLTRGNVGLLILFKPGWAYLMFNETKPYAYLALSYMILIAAVTVIMKKTKLGFYLSGIREDEDAAESLGVRSARCKASAMMISAFLTALGGTIYAQYVQFIDPETLFDVNISVRFALFPIIGGIGSVMGPIIGSAFLTPLDTILRSWLGGNYAGLGFLTYGIVLIVFVMTLPEGIMKFIKEYAYPVIDKLPDINLFWWINGDKPKDIQVQTLMPSQDFTDNKDPLVAIEGVTKRFGGLMALDGVSMKINPGEIIGLIGPNGAGKTTLFNVISGIIKSDGGKITFKKEDITNLSPPHNVCIKGIGRTFQVVKPFPEITVLDNIVVGAWLRTSSLKYARQKAEEVLNFVGLDRYQDYHASNLTLADRKRLELARALATSPQLLLLDEVMAGLNPAETQDIIDIVMRISSELRVTLFIIEHVMKAVMALSQRIYVLDYGKVIANGRPEQIAGDKSVIKAYLGEEYLYHVEGSKP